MFPCTCNSTYNHVFLQSLTPENCRFSGCLLFFLHIKHCLVTWTWVDHAYTNDTALGPKWKFELTTHYVFDDFGKMIQQLAINANVQLNLTEKLVHVYLTLNYGDDSIYMYICIDNACYPILLCFSYWNIV